MTLYQKEMLRLLPTLECEGKYNPETEMLDITYHKIPMCSQNNNGYIFEDGRGRATGNLAEIQDAICVGAEKIREYVGLYESSPQMPIQDVKQYRKLSEFGDTVLAAMYSEQHGFMFTTWKQNNAKTFVTHGDYSPNFEHAKISFAIRAGLINKEQLFSEEEAADIYKCVGYTRDNCENLTFLQEERLRNLSEKLQYGYPNLEYEPDSFYDQSDSPKMNM